MPVYDWECCGQWESYVPTRHTPEYCPDCGKEATKVWVTSPPAALGDDIPGGQLVENLGHEPVLVYSHSERRRLAAAAGLQEFVRHQPAHAGTDKSPHTTNWATIAPETLQGAKEMLEAHAKVKGPHRAAERLSVPFDWSTRTIPLESE